MAIKSDDKKTTIKSDDNIKVSKLKLQQEKILLNMKSDKEYKLSEFCELLSLRETRTKTILKPLINDGIIVTVGGNKDRRYKIRTN